MKQLARNPLSLATLLFLAALVCIRLVALPETDIFFSIYHGQHILAGGSIVAPDTWNFFTSGKEWISNSWLWDVLLGIAYNAAGLIGVSLLNGLCYALACALAWSIATSLGLSNWKHRLGVSAFALSSFTFFTVRAVNTDFLLTLTFCWLALKVILRLSGYRRMLSIALLAFLTALLGTNLHLSGPIYGLLLPSLTAILLMNERLLARAKYLIIVGFATLTGVLCTPYGLDGITKVSEVAGASRQLIIEWNSPSTHTFLGWIVIIVCVLATGLLIWLLVKKFFLSALLVLVLEVATLEAIRFVVYLILIAFILTCIHGWRWHLPERLRPTPLTPVNRWLLVGLTAAATLVCAFSAAATYSDGGEALTHVNPQDYKAFAANSRVLSNPSEGSAILFYRRDLQVAIDGRNDLLGAARYTEVTHVFAYASVPELRAWLNKNHVNGIFVTDGELSDLSKRFAQLKWQAHPGQYGTAFTRP